jgi:hypothetical protein
VIKQNSIFNVLVSIEWYYTYTMVIAVQLNVSDRSIYKTGK